ncbi:Ent-kaurene oxidase [Paramyrothecium foliicola]|nr:Ent-kaurene oxidase [Paramyrothecium foliicola]
MDNTTVDFGFPIGLSSRWPLIGTCFTILLSAWLAKLLIVPRSLAQIPHVGKGTVNARRKQFSGGAAWELYAEGYRRIKAGADHFRLATTAPSETIVVSTKYLAELKKLPDDVLSVTEAIKEVMQARYTGLEVDTPGVPHTVKASLTPALGENLSLMMVIQGIRVLIVDTVRLNPTISEEVYEALSTELPQTNEWSEVYIFAKLLRIVAMVSGRIFVGPELCRDENYLDVAINYTVDLVKAAHEAAAVPQWRRPYSAPFLPSVKQVAKRVAEAEKLLQPIVAKRLENVKNGGQKPDDMLQWIIDDQVAQGRTDENELARIQLNIAFAAIHTTTITTSNVLYTLAVMPDLIPMLREDVEQAVADANGEFTNLTLQNMKKLDSFIKEVMRFYPLAPSAFTRKVLKPFTLSSGQHIPAGVYIEAPIGGINTDDDFFPDAGTFDALRYYKLRLSKEKEKSHTKAAEVVANSQFISVGTSSLLFGYGRHACPGRFFAANEIKMILAVLLQNYEIQNPPGVTERHPNQLHGAQSLPDPTKPIMVRKL